MSYSNDAVVRDALSHVPGNGGYTFWDHVGVTLLWGHEWDLTDIRHPKFIVKHMPPNDDPNHGNRWGRVIYQFEWRAKQEFQDLQISMSSWAKALNLTEEEYLLRHAENLARDRGNLYWKVVLLRAIVAQGKIADIATWEYEHDPQPSLTRVKRSAKVKP